MKKKVKKLFAGGIANTVGSQVGSAAGLNPGVSGLLGNTAQAGVGIATGNPMDIASGIGGMLTSQISDASSIFKNEDATGLDKFMALNPLTASLTAGDLAQKGQRQDDFNTGLIERNQRLGLAFGGSIGQGGSGLLEEFENGGLHENNKFGGIPLNYNEEGQLNTAEEGETKLDDYVYSNRLLVPKNTAGLPNKLSGKTFADASKIINKPLKQRPNDEITKRTANRNLQLLADSNDNVRVSTEQQEELQFRCGGKAYFNGGKIKEGDYELEDVTQEEVEYLKSQGFNIEIEED